MLFFNDGIRIAIILAASTILFRSRSLLTLGGYGSGACVQSPLTGTMLCRCKCKTPNLVT
jgi:hypothetical protein